MNTYKVIRENSEAMNLKLTKKENPSRKRKALEWERVEKRKRSGMSSRRCAFFSLLMRKWPQLGTKDLSWIRLRERGASVTTSGAW